MKEIIKLKDISYSYGDVKAVEDVNVSVYSGEVVSILGPNGAGKTTLLKCILKLLKPYGAILINGKEINTYHMKDLAKILGYVPQIPKVVFPYRVIDYVLMGRAPHHSIFSLPSKKEYDKAMEILRILGIEYLANRAITDVSGGQFQLIQIARALIQDAKILLLDEPTAHLDISNEFKVLRIVRKLVHRNIIEASIMTLHDPLIASLFSDKIILMHNGKVVAYGAPKNILTNEILYEVYGVNFDIITRGNMVFVLPSIREKT